MRAGWRDGQGPEGVCSAKTSTLLPAPEQVCPGTTCLPAQGTLTLADMHSTPEGQSPRLPSPSGRVRPPRPRPLLQPGPAQLALDAAWLWRQPGLQQRESHCQNSRPFAAAHHRQAPHSLLQWKMNLEPPQRHRAEGRLAGRAAGSAARAEGPYRERHMQVALQPLLPAGFCQEPRVHLRSTAVQSC